MKKEAQKASARKHYEKPQIKQVKLETAEATLGTSACWGNPGFEASDGFCPGSGCAQA